MIDLHTAFINTKKSYKKNITEILALINKEYPDFVFQGDLKTLRHEIPVFTFHSAEPARFEWQMRYLRQNGYQTLNADEVYECITGQKEIPERSVCLTFDDGWGTVWTVAYPILKKYHFKAVCFLVPGMINEGKERLPNLDDISGNTSNQKEIVNRDYSAQPLCTWREIREMHKEGIIDFQSHGMYHSLIFISSKIVDFINPFYDFYKRNINVPLLRKNGIDNYSREVAWGTPIYENESRLVGKRRFFDDDEVRRACIDHVREKGNLKFFRRPNWRGQLGKTIRKSQNEKSQRGYFESEEEMKANIFSELRDSKKIIETNLGNKSVSHFCFPWWRASALATELSKQAGYISNYLGIVKEKRTVNKSGDDPFSIGRLLSDDYIFRLPGKGRKSLIQMIHEISRAGFRSYWKKTSAKK